MAVVHEIKVPLLAVNDTSLTVVEMAFAQGAAVKTGQVVMILETSKTTYDLLAEADGYISYLCVAGQDYEVNETVANIYSSKEELPLVEAIIKQQAVSVADKEEMDDAAAVWEGDTMFSPAAIRLMQQNNLAATAFKGMDFVSKLDVEQKLGIAKPATVKKTANGNTAMLPVDIEKVTVEKLSPGKKREIEYLSSVQQTGLTSTINTMVDTAGIFVHINPSLQYLKNSLLPVMLYETARLLEKYKALNAYFTGDAIAYYKQVNIGFAIDIDKGLKVVKVKDAGVKQVNEIERAILDLSDKYLDDTLQLEDLTDISFTVTDLSAEKVAFFRPLINKMNSAILGVSAIDEKLQRCILSVTFDHRVTEGKLVALFLQELKERLQSYRASGSSDQQLLINQHISCFKCFKTLQEDMSEVGFARCITPNGTEAYICQSCLKGF
jgi:pyruvate/2-oxoglutarate dehydrogenase complex dihydrolipoamide acyltransferase (E2) component